jgi:hypothetical protein
MLLKLARGAAFDCPMPGVVRSRGELVDDQFSVAFQKHLDREQSHEIETYGDGAGEFVRRQCHPVFDPRRRHGEIENVIAMDVSQTGKTAVAPSGPRATMTEISFSYAFQNAPDHSLLDGCEVPTG